MEGRRQLGVEIAAAGRLTHKGRVWSVPSTKNPRRSYQVNLRPKTPTCTCQDYELRRRKCKHIFAVEYALAHPQ
ncbi:MAG TPA: SWIM zinc finger family protein, partial [Pyrinomonadaceae bacterium]|nr:SWIM zinc finger family protein [Pyrinomonadaceae bacterium]